ncbi:toxin Ldr, type I toxin-antitoxin system family protein [Escherichia coli]|nr:toxin Ldr, type I toxin-antitoxin system family protein [Escherichia coli]KEJ07880.1 toxin Ldr, type I toxin-antitoxin system family protein [Escherichia coli 8-415-05_S4_C2]KEJ08545.1 toxin Ldr, type I toxin-antitoxin system family protein [Escherichia coli 8-415-05_S4_C1]KEJ28323.1 toxin Ldr, type I toxin-antitoxin system family protein [Escherichia coli 8-415-05_S4_C3]KEN34275.1 toxin Ldr, type I toxin-antitoxin system family protein [Escherichia coli 8-415-05_S3_C3]KEN42946.1 toxin Ldr,
MLSLQQKGGYMTLAQFAVIFWHDLAAPILAGIITAAIVGWWRSRK